MAYTNISGKKLQSKLASTLNESATSHSPALLNSNQSFAKRQLEKMGWTEGTGLGKKRDGMKSHVKIKKREDNMGLGQEKVQTKEMENVWWKDSVGGTLARLQANKKKKNDNKKSISEKKKKNKKDKKSKKKSKQESSSSEDSVAIKTYTDEELFEATGGARFGTKGGRRAEGKHKRTESSAELTVLEQKAKASMEWNGRGDAQVVIDKKKQKKKRKHADDTSEGDSSSNVVSPNISEEEEVERTTSDDDKQSKKKRRKLEKKKEQLHQVSLSDNDDVATAAKKKSKKESKKMKKKPKKSDR